MILRILLSLPLLLGTAAQALAESTQYPLTIKVATAT